MNCELIKDYELIKDCELIKAYELNKKAPEVRDTSGAEGGVRYYERI